MTIFNYSRWVAKEITSKKNIDKKIFIVGPPGSGKSKTALAFAKAIDKWISYYVYGNFDHCGEYFKLDEDHIAVINADDLLKLMIKKLPKHNIKISDDCGTTEGVTSRRSMSQKNLDVVEIYSTNRTDNGVLIICLHDEAFADLRMRKLANESIDLGDYVQDGPFRIAKLRKLKNDKNNKRGIRETPFTTIENGEMVIHDSIAVFMPDEKTIKWYDELRDQKQSENAQRLLDKYSKIDQDVEVKSSKPKCPKCGWTSRVSYKARTKQWECTRCHIPV